MTEPATTTLNILNTIIAEVNNSTIEGLVKKVLHNAEPLIKNASVLISLRDLAYWLYIVKEKTLSLKTAMLVNTISYDGDFDIWSPVQSMLILQSRIYKETGDTASAEKCIDTITDVLSVETAAKVTVLQKTFNRRLRGSLLRYEKITAAQKNNDARLEILWRFSHFIELCFIKEMGGSELFPLLTVEKEIQEHMQFLADNASTIHEW